MPLVLSVRRGQQFTIDGRLLTCTNVGHEVVVHNEGVGEARFYCSGTLVDESGVEFSVTDVWQAVGEGVWLRAGHRHHRKGRLLSLQINAAGLEVRRITKQAGAK